MVLEGSITVAMVVLKVEGTGPSQEPGTSPVIEPESVVMATRGEELACVERVPLGGTCVTTAGSALGMPILASLGEGLGQGMPSDRPLTGTVGLVMVWLATNAVVAVTATCAGSTEALVDVLVWDGVLVAMLDGVVVCVPVIVSDDRVERLLVVEPVLPAHVLVARVLVIV